jgi:hypothetical protein
MFLGRAEVRVKGLARCSWSWNLPTRFMGRAEAQMTTDGGWESALARFGRE